MRSKCSSCGATGFEISTGEICNSTKAFDFVQCAACGAVVSAMETTPKDRLEAALVVVGEALGAVVKDAVADTLKRRAATPDPNAQITPPKDGLVPTRRVADHFRVCAMTVHRWGKEGCPRKRIGGTWRYNLADVEAWHQHRKTP